MKLKLLAVSALAALALGAGFAQAAESSVVEAKASIIKTPTTQVAYPPKCGNPIFPRYCRRW